MKSLIKNSKTVVISQLKGMENKIESYNSKKHNEVLDDDSLPAEIKFDKDINIIVGDRQFDDQLKAILQKDIFISIIKGAQLIINLINENYFEVLNDLIITPRWNLYKRLINAQRIKVIIKELEEKIQEVNSKFQMFCEKYEEGKKFISVNNSYDTELLEELKNFQKESINFKINELKEELENIKKIQRR